MSAPDEINHTLRYAPPVDLSKFAWLSVAAAVVTIGLKGGAAWLTGSVGLLSDAAESLVNLVAAIVALFALKVAIKPPDDNHPYGHSNPGLGDRRGGNRCELVLFETLGIHMFQKMDEDPIPHGDQFLINHIYTLHPIGSHLVSHGLPKHRILW